MWRAFKRHWRDAVQGILRHFTMSISAASAITVTLLLMAVMLLIMGNVAQITRDLQESVKIFVKIDNSLEESQIPALQDQVLSLDGVTYVEYSDKDNELDKLEQEFGESGKMFETYRENNPLSRAFIVEIGEDYSIAEVSNRIAALPGITQTDFGGATTEQYISVLSSVRIGGVAVILGLLLLAVVLVNNTIKITITAREEEIAIMRYVGATNSYIRAPFMLEGIFLGIMGAVVPIAATIIGYDAAYRSLDGKIVTGVLKLLPVFPFTAYVSGILIGFGIVVGFIGSFFAVNKNLRWTR